MEVDIFYEIRLSHRELKRYSDDRINCYCSKSIFFFRLWVLKRNGLLQLIFASMHKGVIVSIYSILWLGDSLGFNLALSRIFDILYWLKPALHVC